MTDGGPVAVVVGGGGPPDATRRDLGDLGDDPFVVAADEGLVHAIALRAAGRRCRRRHGLG